MRIFLVLLLCSPAFSQVSSDEAYARLRARQMAATRAASRPSPGKSGPQELSRALKEGLIDEVNPLLNLALSSDPISTAQREEILEESKKAIEVVRTAPVGNTYRAKVLVLDVEKSGEGRYVATTTIDLPKSTKGTPQSPDVWIEISGGRGLFPWTPGEWKDLPNVVIDDVQLVATKEGPKRLKTVTVKAHLPPV